MGVNTRNSNTNTKVPTRYGNFSRSGIIPMKNRGSAVLCEPLMEIISNVFWKKTSVLHWIIVLEIFLEIYWKSTFFSLEIISVFLLDIFHFFSAHFGFVSLENFQCPCPTGAGPACRHLRYGLYGTIRKVLRPRVHSWNL